MKTLCSACPQPESTAQFPRPFLPLSVCTCRIYLHLNGARLSTMTLLLRTEKVTREGVRRQEAERRRLTTTKVLFSKSDQEIKVQTLLRNRWSDRLDRSSGHGLDAWRPGTKLTGQTETESLKRRREASSVASAPFQDHSSAAQYPCATSRRKIAA